jgi:DNA adenine methylase
MNPLFTSPGSKTRLAKTLISLYPRHHTYIEPFAGGAACFWRKTPSPLEILNDYDRDVSQAYQVVRDTTPDQLNDLIARDWIISEQGFSNSLTRHPDPIEDTYRFLYRRRASFGSKEKKLYRTRVGNGIAVPKQLKVQKDRLRGVQVFCGDGLALMKQHDRPDVFMFLDPPWPGYHWKWKHYEMSDLTNLIETLKGLKHSKWLYAETTTLDETHDIPDQFYRTELSYIGTGYQGKKTKRTELILSNYEVSNGQNVK